MNSLIIRNLFIDFFVKNGHKNISGSSIIPTNDNTLLFTNAGMNQFKNNFLDPENSILKSATTFQRCIRAGGKHNDLQNVGFTSRHLTCFEMLGNFSFGNYFKKEAIFYAWSFLTDVLKLEKNLLWVTVFKDDDESFNIWKNYIKVDENKIIKLSEKDNFWQMGDVGPCGPCSEIYYDFGIKNKIDENAKPGDDNSERFIEIWNLVFMQFMREKDGQFFELKKKGIDTGMGLERLSMVMQKVNTVYETDSFQIIIKEIEKISGKDYKFNKSAFNVLSDHIRSASLIISENIVPSNEGRGYVLRKIIRRALLFSQKLSENKYLFTSLVSPFLNSELALYSDLKNKINFIEETIKNETEKFFDNLIAGKRKFEEFLKNINNNIFSGEYAFILYDTYGFPLEITEIFSNEKGLIIDYYEYEKHMQKQKDRSKENSKFKDIEFNSIKNIEYKTEFIGYENFKFLSKIQAIFIEGNECKEVEENKDCMIIPFESPFYPGGGGEVADSGNITINNENIIIKNIKKIDNAICIFIQSKSKIKVNDEIDQFIDINKRNLKSAHHTATHLLHATLKKFFLDEEINQEGSFVSDRYLTLDCSLKKNLTKEDIYEIEKKINSYIKRKLKVEIKNMSYDEAINNGFTALFTDKYNKEKVRTVSIEEDTSKELCGGTHVKNTNEIGFFILKNVEAVSSGIKRFTAIVSDIAYEEIYKMQNIFDKARQILKCSDDKIEENILKNSLNILELKKDILKQKEKRIKLLINNYVFSIKSNFEIFEIDNDLKEFEKDIMKELQFHKKGFYIFIFQNNENSNIYGFSSDDLTLKYSVNDLSKILIDKFEFKGKVTQNSIVGITKIKIIKENLINFLN
jgi:alanyl-tRNA synthetase